MEKRNAKQMPKKFMVRHMNNGLAGYEDEKILVSTETMKKMCKSFDAKPVYVGHQGVDVEKLQEQSDGYVSRCFYNELDGWLWAEIIIVSDEGQEAIAKGWSVSNAYIPTQSGPGGTCHDIEYKREILDGDFTHLAIVPNPRYEEATIMTPEEFKVYQADKKNELEELKNSKNKKGANIMFWFKKEVTTPEELENASYTLKDGTAISIADMVKAVEVENAKKNETKEEEKLNLDAEIAVGEDRMTLKELINRYQELDKEKSNADDEDDKSKESSKKRNTDDEEKDKENKDEEMKNSKFFDELKNASKVSGITEKSKPHLKLDGLELGKKNY